MKPYNAQTEPCHHGCGRIASFTSAKNVLCCESNVAKCPAVKARIGTKTKACRSTTDESGQTYAQKLASDKRKAHLSQGKPDPFKTAATKMVATRRAKGSYETAHIKALATKQQVDDNGTSVLQRATKQMVATRSQIRPDGLTAYQESARRGTATKLADIDELGRNGFDRMWITAGQAHNYPNTLLYYRSKLELAWLDNLQMVNGIDWINNHVTNCASLKYVYKGVTRNYLPDFAVDGVLYEIKSSYTWDNFGKNDDWFNKNTAKLNAAISIGHEIKLVLDGTQLDWRPIFTRAEWEQLLAEYGRVPYQLPRKAAHTQGGF